MRTRSLCFKNLSNFSRIGENNALREQAAYAFAKLRNDVTQTIEKSFQGQFV